VSFVGRSHTYNHPRSLGASHALDSPAREKHLTPVTRTGLKYAFIFAYRSVWNYDLPQRAAALSYYLVLSLFPALILFLAVINGIHVRGLLAPASDLILRILPMETVLSFQSVLSDALSSNIPAWSSIGTIGTVWVASSAFEALIEALDLAYEVKDPRPFWKTRLLAIALAAASGVLLVCVLSVMIAGPRFGAWLATRMEVSVHFVRLWPALHWTIAIVFTLLVVELLYFIAPNIKQRFLASLPGAFLAVLCFVGLSYLLGYYVRHIGHFNQTYGTLAGLIAFMLWCYWNSFALLVGARLNAELAKQSPNGPLAVKGRPRPDSKLRMKPSVD
jgi:membrane protein